MNNYILLILCTIASSALYIIKQLFTRDERTAETILTNFIYVAINSLVIQFTVEGDKIQTAVLSAIMSSIGYYIAFTAKRKFDKGSPRLYYITCKTSHATSVLSKLLYEQHKNNKIGYQISKDGRKDKSRTIIRVFSMNRNDSKVLWDILSNVGSKEIRVYHQEIKIDV